MQLNQSVKYSDIVLALKVHFQVHENGSQERYGLHCFIAKTHLASRMKIEIKLHVIFIF